MYISIAVICIVVLISVLASIPLIAFGKPNSMVVFNTWIITNYLLNLFLGIRGFANLEECAIGALHALDAFNFLTGLLFAIVFATVLVIICFVTKYIGGTSSKLATALRYIIAVLLIVSTIVGFCDIIYSFYIASQVYGQYDEFKQGQVNCSSSVYYSSFVSVIIVFLYIYVEVGLAIFLILWLKIDFTGRIFG